MRWFFSRVFPWPFILAGAAVFYFGMQEWELADVSPLWPTVPGIVQSSKIEWDSNDDHGSSAFARVVYTYDVKGETHTANRVLFGDYGSSDSSHADRIVSQYTPGQQVTVYYRPSDPSIAVLQPGAGTVSYLLPGFGILFLVVGLAMLWFLPQILTASSDGTAPAIGGLPITRPSDLPPTS